ncbi:MAG: LUD domain-containing protein [Ferruginibacter sp.]|nr:LUD domain-containing protein [Ferruginibacter sp.]
MPKKIISVAHTFLDFTEVYAQYDDPHKAGNVDVAIITAHFGEDENGPVWVTEELLHERVLLFICQHLVAIINKENTVVSMHDACDKIASMQYGFGTFIPGPSKTPDIEQSLVLGAHGPKKTTVFIISA